MSNFAVEKIKRVRVYVEPNGSYAVDNQANVATAFSDIKTKEFSMDLTAELLENDAMMQRLDRKLPKVLARRRSKASLTTYLNGTGTAADVGVTAVTSSLSNIFEAVMGGQHHSKGTGVVSCPAAGNFVLDSAATIYPGSAIGWVNPTTNRMECVRVVASSSINTITSSVGFSAFPASGSVLYGSTTCYLTQDPDTSLQFYVEGGNFTDKYNLLGLQGGFKLKTELGQLPEATFDFEGANWVTGSATNEIANANFDDATPPPFVDGIFYAAIATAHITGSRSNLPVLDIASIELTPTIAYVDVTTEMGVNNILRKRRNRTAPVMTGKFTTYVTDADLIEALMEIRDNIYYGGANKILRQQQMDIGLQIGTQPGSTVFIAMPQCQITNIQRIGVGDLAGYEVSFDVLEDEVSVGSVDTDLAKSAFIVSFL